MSPVLIFKIEDVEYPITDLELYSKAQLVAIADYHAVQQFLRPASELKTYIVKHKLGNGLLGKNNKTQIIGIIHHLMADNPTFNEADMEEPKKDAKVPDGVDLETLGEREIVVTSLISKDMKENEKGIMVKQLVEVKEKKRVRQTILTEEEALSLGKRGWRSFAKGTLMTCIVGGNRYCVDLTIFAKMCNDKVAWTIA